MGEWNIAKLKREMSAKDFLGWERYAAIEPFGELRADYRAASIAGMIFNMAVAQKDRKPFTEWLLQYKEQETKKQPTPEQVAKKQFELLNIYARAYAGSEPVADTAVDRLEQKRLQDQVARAHAAMKET